MALAHALLLSLAEQNGSGYELTSRFDRSIGYFYSATHQQIYRTLRRMEDDSWLRCTVVDQEGRPAKKVYDVAELGYRELSRWVNSAEGTDMRDLALKVRAGTYGEIDAVVEHISVQRDAHAVMLDNYREMEKRQFPAPDQLTGAALHQYLVLRGGVRMEEGFTDWCDEMISALSSPNVPARTDESEDNE
ncbi:PadR family transcriptional regulator [Mycobacterium sp. CBMA271]|uniref:PadR family transcriptional regulator n=1 Tax=unclassified Mycobacteroides TaxID=2618759 RepID=UPI0012DF7C32|nr:MULTISPECIES: PadR family transcriptional regulator [unclassified Mycobacteroides]MUM16624.1 PadR family transcriptional regulator [Mycobacteroides sp. CBMA 326]MUM22068.1 PadR family transcriptional regulator [Mycobacteroides sp. CBMA 271]